MDIAAQIEKAALNLSVSEREHIALAVWASLEADPALAADPMMDAEGIALARTRDAEIESGRVESLSHSEFLRQTRPNA